MASRAAFDKWISSTDHAAHADLIYSRFCTSIQIEEALSLVDLSNPFLASFCTSCDPVTFTTDGSPYRWVPRHFLYAMKNTDAHKRAVDRAISGVAGHLIDAPFWMWSVTLHLLYSSCTLLRRPPWMTMSHHLQPPTHHF